MGPSDVLAGVAAALENDGNDTGDAGNGSDTAYAPYDPVAELAALGVTLSPEGLEALTIASAQRGASVDPRDQAIGALAAEIQLMRRDVRELRAALDNAQDDAGKLRAVLRPYFNRDLRGRYGNV